MFHKLFGWVPYLALLSLLKCKSSKCTLNVIRLHNKYTKMHFLVIAYRILFHCERYTHEQSNLVPFIKECKDYCFEARYHSAYNVVPKRKLLHFSRKSLFSMFEVANNTIVWA